MISKKKAITAIVSTALLLIVAVVAVIYFNNFYTTFQSKVFAETEQNINKKNQINVEKIIDNFIYIKTNNNNFSIKKFQINDENGNIICDETNLFHPNLIHYYNFDIENYTYIKDLINKNSYGEAYLGVWPGNYINWTNNGYLNGAFYANGLPGEFIKINYSYDIMKNEELTYSMWINLKSHENGNDAFMSIIGAGSPLQSGAPYIMYYPDYVLYQVPTTQTYPRTYSDTLLNLNQWNNLVLTYSNITKKIEVFINGNPVSIISQSIGTQDLYQGKYSSIFAHSNSGSTINGSIDELKIYNKVLNEDEILQIYIKNKLDLILNNKKIHKLKLTCNLEKNKVYDTLITNNKVLNSKRLVVG